MILKEVPVLENISAADFRQGYYLPQLPVVIKSLAKSWPASNLWGWDYFKEKLGNIKVGIYNNVKSDSYTPINTADGYTTIGEYIDNLCSGNEIPYRIFLFNLFDHAPELIDDFSWPEEYMTGFIKKYPMLFTGAKGSITHMHFDIDLSDILHTQYGGRKRVLLFPFDESPKLYRKPFEVLSMVDFTNYYLDGKSKIDYNRFPAVAKAEGYEVILEPGDTLYMPCGYWHHMEYLESGFALSLRAFPFNFAQKARGMWNLFGMRTIDTAMKKTVPEWWYNWKQVRIKEAAELVLH